MSLFGLVSQLISLIVFWRVRVKARLFVYMLFYTINNALVCILLFIQLLHHLYLSHNYATTMFMARVNLPFLAIGYQNTFFLIILVLLDMLSNFNTTIEKIMNKSTPIRHCVLNFIISFVPHLSVFFVFQEEYHQYKGDWSIVARPLFQSQAGLCIILILLTVFDFSIIPVHVYLQIWSFVKIKRHMRRKSSCVMSQRLYEQYQSTDMRTTAMFIYFGIISLFEHLFRVLLGLSFFEFSIYLPHEQIESICLLFIVTMRTFSFFNSLIFNRTFRQEFFHMIRIC